MDADGNEREEKDINDVFDTIALSEEIISKEAFLEGLIKGQKDGKFEGYHLGFHSGFELGNEIGFYEGLTKLLLTNLSDTDKKNKKILPLLEKLSHLLKNFPNYKSQDVDFQETVNEIRANYKKLNSLLKLNISFPVSSGTSF